MPLSCFYLGLGGEVGGQGRFWNIFEDPFNQPCISALRRGHAFCPDDVCRPKTGAGADLSANPHQIRTRKVEITAEIRSIGLSTLPFCPERSRFMIPCPSPIYRPPPPAATAICPANPGKPMLSHRPCFLKLPRQAAVPVRVVPSPSHMLLHHHPPSLLNKKPKI